VFCKEKGFNKVEPMQAVLARIRADKMHKLEEGIAEPREAKVEELAILKKISAEIHRSLDLQEILERALDSVLSSLRAEAGFIFLLDDARDEFTLKAQRGMRSKFIHELVTMKAGCDFPAVTLELEESIAVRKISEYPRLGGFLQSREGFHSYVSVPLSVEGNLLGIMNIFSRNSPPTPRELDLLLTVGQQIGIAIDNARLFQKVVRAKREWEETFDAITEGIFMLDEEFNILRANIAFAKMLGTTPDKIIGKKCYRLLHNRDEPPDYCPKVQVMETGESQIIEVREPTLESHLLLSLYPLRDPEGNVDRLVSIVQDITLRKRLQAQLMQTEKFSAIGRLAQGIAHNLITPLTVIKGRAQLISEEIRDCFEEKLPALLHHMAGHKLEMPSDIAQAYEDICQELLAIERGCQTMQEIIDNLMYKSRREQEQQKQLIDINDLLWQELKFLDGDPRFKHSIEKVYNFCEEPLYVEGVYSHFSQSFSNIIRNAIDAMEGCEKPVLTITTRCSEEFIYVDIHDTGVGIPPENIPRLFEPFFTTKPIKGSNPTGTGLGLHTCYQLLSPYGVQFEVKSQPGDTTFTVKIPRQRM